MRQNSLYDVAETKPATRHSESGVVYYHIRDLIGPKLLAEGFTCPCPACQADVRADRSIAVGTTPQVDFKMAAAIDRGGLATAEYELYAGGDLFSVRIFLL
jgi:hypothetical protein